MNNGNSPNKNRVEFGDFQTPRPLADKICRHLAKMGIQPDILIEPTCGLGSFLLAGAKEFVHSKRAFGFDINNSYIEKLACELRTNENCSHIHVARADFFQKDWHGFIGKLTGRLLVLGNLPWVTNATLGTIGGTNAPQKSNFMGMKGFDAISGKSNFDISEWMFLEIMRWLTLRGGAAALLVKTSTARKVLAHAQREQIPVAHAQIVKIDAKKHFSANVDACLLVTEIKPEETISYDYTVFASL